MVHLEVSKYILEHCLASKLPIVLDTSADGNLLISAEWKNETAQASSKELDELGVATTIGAESNRVPTQHHFPHQMKVARAMHHNKHPHQYNKLLEEWKTRDEKIAEPPVALEYCSS